ncbi:MAG: hypothetical protein E7292_02930 [Lachnospiraceae bacterium]|nr:hypothetical protein [Lachnospiraceae bacterium]
MKNKKASLMAGILIVSALLTGCGADPEITQFKNDLDSFCEKVAELDEAINAIDAEDENATSLALGYLDKLDVEFQNFAEMDFPEEYDYLESLADEAGAYMTESVTSYHSLYESDEYDEDTATYARETSARAFKRVQVILDVLQGEYTGEDTSSGNADDSDVSQG